ncbi:MAG TPA: UDP-3-O-(3-hydroxymyristoyl)glucosamine N-acyltransferase, partial [Rhodospirillaceae bacterium]|nr:UDP-3-O-(3-hydroxymyristoyl)glucosamine N-acyltransferase [Rhodospirillaceae bacterium]
KVPQLGRVLIGSHVEIGANTCIDRGAGPDTIIGAGTWIDNMVQIGHNVRVGKGCVIVAQVGIAGSAVIDDFVALGGQSGIAGHLHIGQGARIAAQAGVMRDVPPGEEQAGTPAMPSKQMMRQIIALNRLAERKKES